jgi:hypothetical protein
MKTLLLTIAILFNLNSFGADVENFSISSAKGKFASVFLVSGGQGLSSFEVQRVYKKVGTFRVSGGDVEVPSSSYQRYGWRGPSHVLVVTHNQKELALNKVMSNEFLRFVDPTYSIQSERVYPTPENIQYVGRKAILLKSVVNSSLFLF